MSRLEHYKEVGNRPFAARPVRNRCVNPGAEQIPLDRLGPKLVLLRGLPGV
jgi:hypothetical protein